jgi:hypothetical protein
MRKAAVVLAALFCAGAAQRPGGELAWRTIARRAVDAVIWGMPAVDYDLMYQQMVKAGGRANQILYWSRLPDWKNQTLTPDPDSISFMPFFNTKEVGPIVLEIPSADSGSISGTVMNCWQTPLGDVGPGRYLILPPGYRGQTPDGYTVLRADTYEGYALLRAVPVAHGRRIRLYPLSEAPTPKPTTFVDAANRVFDSTIPYDLRFFQSLDRIVQSEPWLERDKAMIDPLRSIGIEKGQPFDPDVKVQAVLKEAAREAHDWLDAHYTAMFWPPYYQGTRWAMPGRLDLAEGYPVDARGVHFSFAFSSGKQFSLVTIQDKESCTFGGGYTYRLHVPARQDWSATAYDRATHALIREMPWGSRSSQTPGLEENADKSVDLYFGPKAPAGKESNWIPTKADGVFEIVFRLYGPIDDTWRLPDVERVR